MLQLYFEKLLLGYLRDIKENIILTILNKQMTFQHAQVIIRKKGYL